MKSIPLIAALVFASLHANAVTRNAASCSASDIQTQINLSSSGDIVQIPTCAAGSWTSGGIDLVNGVIVQGNGSANTIINWNGTGSAVTMATNSRLTALRINRTGTGNEIFAQAANSSGWRVDNGIFDNNSNSGTGNAMWNMGTGDSVGYSASWGLFDNNQFIDLTGENGIFKGPCNSWKTAHSKGGVANWFFEDNTFTSTTSAYLDFHNNARVVLRNNNITNVYFDGHGVWSNISECSGQTLRGSATSGNAGSRGVRHMEVYNNTWVSGANFRIVNPRGGSGMIYGNRISNSTNKVDQMIMLDEYCARASSGDRAACVAACPSSSAAPLLDQIGRGIDIASLPVDGTGEQTSEPFLIWDNLYSDNTKVFMSPGDDTGFSWSCTDVGLDAFIVEGRDYCMGTGTQKTVKPTTCNGSSVNYTAYTYPHPLRSGAAAPDAPTNLRLLKTIVGGGGGGLLAIGLLLWGVKNGLRDSVRSWVTHSVHDRQVASRSHRGLAQ